MEKDNKMKNKRNQEKNQKKNNKSCPNSCPSAEEVNEKEMFSRDSSDYGSGCPNQNKK